MPRGPKREPPPLRVLLDQAVHNAIATAIPEVLDALNEKDLDRLERAMDKQLQWVLKECRKCE